MLTEKTRRCFYFFISSAVLFSILSCSSSTQVKPNPKSISQPDVTAANTAQQRSSSGLASMIYQYTRSLNHRCIIEMSLSYYHDAYGRMPDDLTDMLDGFMFIWPGNAYQSGPVKILDSPPDPSKPEHLGNIYYKRYNDHEASLFSLALDMENSIDSNPVYKLGEMPIESATAAYLLHPDDFSTNPYVNIGYSLKDLSVDELRKYAYRRNLSQNISYVLNDNLKCTGYMDENLGNILIHSRYYISKPGLDNLKQKATQNEIYFDMGKYLDDKHVYYICREPDKEKTPECRFFDDDEGDYGGIAYNVKCPDSVDSVSVISSQNINELSIPENRFLDIEDLY